MTERIMDINNMSSYLLTALKTQKVKIQELNRVITIIPIDEAAREKYSCPFLGIAADSDLTVEKFLACRREERETEYEKDLHS
ncbi:MAG: hypothetical protein FWG36_04535 [Oscillospiraceae bacterium]|nr:hypothetical protein [Oscillospiraceae bacterium]